MNNLNIRDNIPLTYSKSQGGNLVEDLTITVKVINARTGSVLLNTTSCVEVFPGVYTYVWSHNLVDETECIALYSDGGKTYAESFTISDNDTISITA